MKFAQYAITGFPLNERTQDSLRRCNDCEAITHKDERTSKMTFYLPSDEKDKDE